MPGTQRSDDGSDKLQKLEDKVDLLKIVVGLYS